MKKITYYFRYFTNVQRTWMVELEESVFAEDIRDYGKELWIYKGGFFYKAINKNDVISIVEL